MKIVISPSKTMEYENTVFPKTTPIFYNESNKLISIMQKYSVLELAEIFKCSNKIANENYLRFQQFNQRCSPALFSYTGHQFITMNPKFLSEESIQYLQEHLYILSGLYGLLKPLDRIDLYRLPMELTIKNQKLSEFHKQRIYEILNKDIIINLASSEYSKALDTRLNITTIDFLYLKNGVTKIVSMEAKKMRGLFVRFLAENQIETLDDVKKFCQNNYLFYPDLSKDNHFIFLKNNDDFPILK